jgi:hypothetical protein
MGTGRKLPQFFGPSTVLTKAKGPTARDKALPYKDDTEYSYPVKAREPRATRRKQQYRIEHADSELISYLRVEALNQLRTVALVNVLTGKAKRFLEKFDTADVPWERRRSMIIAAVKAAMVIDSEEDSLRQLLKNAEQDELRGKQAKLFKDGDVGHSGLRFPGFGRDSHLSK